jgi:hypothetical protein
MSTKAILKEVAAWVFLQLADQELKHLKKMVLVCAHQGLI